MIVLPFELLRDAPDRFLDHLEDRLGLDHVPFSRGPANVGASSYELAWYPTFTRLIRRLAQPGSRAERVYDRLLYRGRLAPLAGLLQRLRPRSPVTADQIGKEFLERFRGTAACLGDDPLYDPYRADYLL